MAEAAETLFSDDSASYASCNQSSAPGGRSTTLCGRTSRSTTRHRPSFSTVSSGRKLSWTSTASPAQWMKYEHRARVYTEQHRKEAGVRKVAHEYMQLNTLPPSVILRPLRLGVTME